MERLFMLPVALFFCYIASSQQTQESSSDPMAHTAINASGGDVSSSQGSVAYSFGAVFYTTLRGSQNQVSQGIQHPITAESIEPVRAVQAEVVAYPNPTLDHLLIDIVDFDGENGHYQLFDSRGDVIKKSSITGRITKLSMGTLSAATYFLKINVFKKFEKTLKIIKR